MSSADKVLRRYRLHRLLGEGGMGEVWSATDEWKDRKVAIKLLKPMSAGTGDPEKTREERRRLIREARAAWRVRHANVVEVFDVRDDAEPPLLVMELLEGKSLRQHLDAVRRLDVEEACGLLLQVAAGVHAAHEKGVVHRDLKPANILLLRGQGRIPHVKVVDFGIAKVLHRQGASDTDGCLTREGDMIGSPPYMSPEQTFGDADIDHRTDIWSLGIVLYECLSGILPTAAANTGQVIKRITKLGIPPIESVAPHVPSDIAQLLRRMLEQDAQKRLSDLREVIEVLGRHTSVTVPAPGAPKDAQAASFGAVKPLDSADGLTAPPRVTSPDVSTETLARPRRRLAPTLLLMVLASIGVGLGLWRLGEVGLASPNESSDSAPTGGGSSSPAETATQTVEAAPTASEGDAPSSSGAAAATAAPSGTSKPEISSGPVSAATSATTNASGARKPNSKKPLQIGGFTVR